MGNVVQNVTTTADELQVRNGLDNQRVFDPSVYKLMNEVLKELRNIKNELISIREGE